MEAPREAVAMIALHVVKREKQQGFLGGFQEPLTGLIPSFAKHRQPQLVRSNAYRIVRFRPGQSGEPGIQIV